MKKLQPSFYLLLSLLITTALHFFIPVKQLVVYPINLFGLILLIFGVALNMLADRELKGANAGVKPEQIPAALVKSGPYAASRHPMYLGMVLIVFGLALLLGSATSFIGPVLMAIAIEYMFIPPEEKYLEQAFGQKYLDYKGKIRRWF